MLRHSADRAPGSWESWVPFRWVVMATVGFATFLDFTRLDNARCLCCALSVSAAYLLPVSVYTEDFIEADSCFGLLSHLASCLAHSSIPVTAITFAFRFIS